LCACVALAATGPARGAVDTDAAAGVPTRHVVALRGASDEADEGPEPLTNDKPHHRDPDPITP
jgi:hypothetical protein